MSIKDLETIMGKIAKLESIVDGLTARVLTSEKRVAAAEKAVYPDGKRPTRYEITGRDDHEAKKQNKE
jgi:hypothetical protein